MHHWIRRCLALGAIVLLLCQPAWGKTLTVTTLNGSGSGSLRRAIELAASGDTIQFSVTGTITLLRDTLVIDKDLTIVGPGPDQLAISGLGERRVFEVRPGVTAVLGGLAVINGAAENGGGILNEGALTLQDVKVADNVAHRDGGGIFNSQGTLVLIRTQVSHNAAVEENSSGGGIINFEGILELRDNSVVSNNSARRNGGGIDSVRGDLSIFDSVLSGNAAGKEGGAIVVVGDLSVIGSTIADNTAENGAGIANQGLRPAVISDTRFTGNQALGIGGGYFNNANGPLLLSGVTFSGNSATMGKGGGLANIVGDVEIDHGAFSDNTAIQGGGIYNEAVLVVAATLFEGNQAEDGGALRSLGNAIIADSTFTGNAATHGAGIANVGFGSMQLRDTVIRQNVAAGNGGGIANLGDGRMDIGNVQVLDNEAASGGGIWNLRTLTISASTISGNTASNGGGGILNGDSGTLSLKGSVVADNTAAKDGGGIWNDGSLSIQDSEISNNTTVEGIFGGGGGIWNAFTGTLTLIGTSCQANVAGNSNADVYNNGGTVNNLSQCRVH